MTSIDVWAFAIACAVVFPVYWLGIYLTNRKSAANRAKNGPYSPQVVVHKVTSTGGAQIQVKAGTVWIRIEDGGYASATINGKFVELRSKPGEGPKELMMVPDA